MSYSSKIMEDYVVSTIFAIENSQNVEEIKTDLLSMGYDITRIQEGTALHVLFKNAVQGQVAARQDQYAKTTRAKKMFNKAFRVYMGLVDLLRTTFENDNDLMQELGLVGDRERSASGFITQSTHFYNTLLQKDKIFNKISKFQITKEMLQADLALVTDFQKANQEKIDAMGFFQRATAVRNKSYLDLRHWMREFEKTCHIVLKDKPQLIEQLGFQDPSDIVRKRSIPPVPPVPPAPPVPTVPPVPPAALISSSPQALPADTGAPDGQVSSLNEKNRALNNKEGPDNQAM